MKHRLIYDHHAEEWHNALPVGNGRLGAMIWGKPADELIQLNEDSIWSGGFRERNNPKALANLDKIRDHIRNGETEKATALCEDAFYGTNEQQRHYMPLGDLHIFMSKGEYGNYSHTLDLSCGMDTVEFTAENGAVITRECFASRPDEVIVISLRSSVSGKLNFTAYIDGRDDYYDRNEAYDSNTILFTVSDCIPYACAVTGVNCRTDANRFVCENGTEAMLIIACRTSFRTADYLVQAVNDAKTAARKSFDTLKRRHIDDFDSLFSRCFLSLCDDIDDTPTDKRLKALRNGDDSQLAPLTELYFDYSRYLMISGSREGTLPLNLQGIWNKDMWSAWGSKYTININTEMNYWGAEIQNLSECHTPLFDHIERMREHGRQTARKMYGCRGAVCHHNTDIWGDTAPQDKWLPATLWPMGLAWLCTHLWEHYRFTRDKKFLREKLDTLLEACEFFLDYLTENENGELVTNPSLSPENTYITADVSRGTLAEGPSMDSQILHTLFGAVIAAADIVETDENEHRIIEACRAAKSRLPRPAVGKYGQIMEWAIDYDEAEPGHRHISQLYGLYPAELISYDDEVLAGGARATLERRLSHGGGHTGWSRAWIINMWARLHEGEKVQDNIKALLTGSTADSMLDMHPPFQIDGNFGGGAGIAESLLQSINGVITLLPALPPEFSEGHFEGLCARGGFEIDLVWKNSKPISAAVLSRAGEELVIANEQPLIINGKCIPSNDGEVSISTIPGGIYKIQF